MESGGIDLKRPSLSQKIVKNTFYNIIGQFFGILSALFLMPYIIRHIGIERFGLWAIVGMMTGYFGLIDFGIATSFVKYIAEFYTKKEIDKIDQIVNTGVIFYSLLAIIIIAISVLFIKPIIVIFKIPPYLSCEATFVLLVGISIFSCSNVLSPFSAIQAGLQRMDIQNIVSISMSIVNILGTIFFLEKGYGLPGLMVNNAIIFVMAGLINIVIARNILPGITIGPQAFSMRMLNKLFRFGSNLQIARISGVVTSQTSKLLITYFLSIGLVTFYHLGNSIVYYAISISALFIYTLVPAFSEMEASGDRKRLAEAYLVTTRYLSFLLAPFFVFLVVFAPDMMTIWMGQGYGKSALIIRILAIGYALNTIAQVASATCMALDKPRLVAKSAIIVTVLSLILSVAFIKIFGFPGPALAVMFSVNIGTVYFLAVLDKDLRISHNTLMKTIVPYFLAAIVSSGIVAAADFFMNYTSGAASRLLALAALFAHGIVFLILYIAIAYACKAISADDIDFLREKFRFIYQPVSLSKYTR